MCLSPITIYNRSKYVTSSGTPVTMQVKCGRCSECIAEKRDEWTLRSFWELSNSEYGYFDTLTYNDKTLPYFDVEYPSEDGELKTCKIPCFNPEDVQKFLKRLRTNVERAGYGRDAFSFILTSELGGQKFRPHYHFILFVKNKKLEVLKLKELINKSWIFGFTDSFFTTRQRVLTDIRGVSYVTKYISKPQIWNDRIDTLLQEIAHLGEEYQNNIKYALRKVSPFHRQSLHFGAQLLKDEVAVYKAVKDCAAVLPRYQKLAKEIALPMYYRRKLMYDRIIDPADGKPLYVLNDVGKAYKMGHLEKSIDLLAQRYQNIYNNIYGMVGIPESSRLQYRSILHTIMENGSVYLWVNNPDEAERLECVRKGDLPRRSWRDLASYVLRFRGRIIFGEDDSLFSPFPSPCVQRDLYHDYIFDPKEWVNLLYQEDKQLQKETRQVWDLHKINDSSHRMFTSFDFALSILDSFQAYCDISMFSADRVTQDIKDRLSAAKHEGDLETECLEDLDLQTLDLSDYVA